MHLLQNQLKQILRPFIPLFLLKLKRNRWENNQVEDWQKKGSPAPPPHVVKQRTITDYQQKYRLAVFVETGTYMGQMVEAQKTRFKKIISIELGIDLLKKHGKDLIKIKI